MVLVSLVGAQPAPNLLPTRRLHPDIAVLVHTEWTRSIADNLRALLRAECACWLCKVDPYRIPQIRDDLRAFIDRDCSRQQLLFNLTGGTKPMVLAAYRLAHELNSPFVYFRTEGNRSCLYHYAFRNGGVVLESTEELPETISLDDYLQLYLGSYETGDPRDPFEKQVVDVLSETTNIAEVFSSMRPQGMGALEIDFAVRCGNQVGIGEVKRTGAKSGIDQINAVAHPHYLGTYVRKFLISGHLVDYNNRELAEAYRIALVELPSYGETGTLSFGDRDRLRHSVLHQLGGQT